MDKMDFWIPLGVSYVWAALIVTGIAMFVVGMGIMRLIDNRRKEFAEDRFKRVSEGSLNKTNLLKLFSRELPSLTKR